MPVFNLPPVTKDGLAEPKSKGEWFAVTSLSAMARSLRLDKAPIRVDELKSIPDAWAQAQLTTDAFFDQDHDAHSDVVSQWRALLATFALQPRYSSEYDLAINTIDLSDRDTSSKFRQVLQRLLPKPSASLGLDWDKLGVVKLVDRSVAAVDNPAIAFLSPAMLVSPGRMASSFAKASVPWLADGLKDPTNVSGLSSEDRAILTSYLAGLIEAIKSHRAQAIESRRRDALLTQLKAFLDAVRSEVTQGLPTVKTSLALNWPLPFFHILGETQTLDVGGIPASESDCLVTVCTGKASALYQGLILVDPAIAETLNRPPEDVRVWKQYTLRDASASASLRDMKKDAHDNGYLILEKSDLFTQRLVLLDEGAEVPGNPASLRNSLLPLSPIALLLKGLADEAQLSEKGGEYNFSLQLELSRSGSRHKLTEVFAKDQVLKVAPPTDLALWPNFQAEDWPWTFLRFQYDPRSELITRFAASPDFVASSIQTAEASKKRANVAAWSANDNLGLDRQLMVGSMDTIEDDEGRLLLDRFRFRDSAQLVGEQHRLPHGVHAIFFAFRDEKLKSDIPVGCVMIERSEAPQTVDSSVVAFDFGTTNTIAYTKRGDQPSARVTFEDRVVQPVKTEGSKSDVAATYTDFFPVNDHQTPVPTIAKKREFGGGALPAQIREALNDGSDQFGLSHMVFFMPRGGVADKPEFVLGLIKDGLLEFDIKWGETKSDRQLVQSFLKQLMIMVAAELRASGISVANIDWRYSFPQAFSSQHKKAFQSIIQNAWKSLAQDNAAIGSVENRISFSTEADAAMRYFTMDKEQERLGVGRLVVMFDIGGGTSDIAIWKDQGLLWRGSARLAGTHFFNAYLTQNLSLLEALDKDAVRAFNKSGLDQGVVDKNYRAKQLVELIIARRDFADRFDKAYPLHSGEREWAGLRHVAKTALGGLHHYVGLVLAELKEQGKVEDRDIDEMMIALGGRGSTIYRRFMSDGDAQELIDIAKVVGMSSDTLSPPDKIEPRFSQLPKEEVARGLLLGTGGSQPSDAAFQFEPAGLKIVTVKDGQTIVHQSNEDIRNLTGGTEVKEIDLAEMEVFLQNLASATGLRLELAGSDAANTVQLRTRSHLKDQLSSLPPEGSDVADSQDVEAPFITALRHLVEVLANPIDDRDKMISVKERQ